MTLLNIILKQNYFSFRDQIYQPDKGVAMDSPVSGTMAEVFLQHLEETIIKHLIDTKILSFYTRYVDDIFLIYDSTRTNPDNILQYIDTIHNIQLSPTLESNNSVNFLDLSITRKSTHLGIGIYRKPTTTNTTINFLCNHPLEHRMAAYRFLISNAITLSHDSPNPSPQHLSPRPVTCGIYSLSCRTCNKGMWAKPAAASSSATKSTSATSKTTTRNLLTLTTYLTTNMNMVP
jgi:hypothetical protein